jgi:hypothetical protein
LFAHPINGVNRDGVDSVMERLARATASADANCRADGRMNMIVRVATAAAGMALIFSAAPVHAGPCTERIYQTDLDVAKLLHSAASQGGTAPQSAFATMHRQPTPGSIATAEQQVGDLSGNEVQAITEDMDEARHADGADDRDGCEKALSDVDRILKR